MMDLGTLRELAADCPRERLPELMGALTAALAEATLRLHAIPAVNGSRGDRTGDRYLKAEEVAAMLSVSEKWCYANKARLGAVRPSPGMVRFSEKAVRRYMETKAT